MIGKFFRKRHKRRIDMRNMSDDEKRAAMDAFIDDLTGGRPIVCPTYGPPFEPPWIAFPDIPGLGSIGFRMGGGEDYMVQFQKWYRDAPEANIVAFKSTWPEPEHYDKFYDTLDGWHRKPSSED